MTQGLLITHVACTRRQCASVRCRHVMAPPGSHSALDDLLSDTLLPHHTHSCAVRSGLECKVAAGQKYPHATDPHAPAAFWLPAPQTTGAGDHVREQRQRRSGDRCDQRWPFIGAASAGDALGTVCCAAVEVSAPTGVPEDRGHLRATANAATDDKGHLRATAACAPSPANSKKPRGAGRPCYQAIMKVSSLSTRGPMLEQGRSHFRLCGCWSRAVCTWCGGC